MSMSCCCEDTSINPCYYLSDPVTIVGNCGGSFDPEDGCDTPCVFTCALMPISVTVCGKLYNGCLSGDADGTTWTGTATNVSAPYDVADIVLTATEEIDGSGCAYLQVATLVVTTDDEEMTWTWYDALPPEYDDDERPGFVVNKDPDCSGCWDFSLGTLKWDLWDAEQFPDTISYTLSGITGSCCSGLNGTYDLDDATITTDPEGACSAGSTVGGEVVVSARWIASFNDWPESACGFGFATLEPFISIYRDGLDSSCKIHAIATFTLTISDTADAVITFTKSVCPDCSLTSLALDEFDGPFISYRDGVEPDEFCDLSGITLTGDITLL